MPIEVKDLGLQPKVVEGDDGTYNASLVPSTEWTATGKEIHDPEFAKLLDDSAEAAGEEKERKQSIFGMEKLSNPFGGETAIRADKVDFMKSQGYGLRERTTRMVVPELPWNKDRAPRTGRTLIKYRDGRRLVYIDNGLVLEQPRED